MTSLAGSFLIARPSLKDPNFARTVVLVLAHGEEGAHGVVVNRPVPVDGFPLPVYLGGPCESPGLLLLHGHQEWAEARESPEKSEEERDGEVAPGIFLGDVRCWNRATDPETGAGARVRVVRGYAGWGPGQLEGEMAQGVWEVTPADGQLLFDTPAEDLWPTLAPPALPQPSLN